MKFIKRWVTKIVADVIKEEQKGNCYAKEVAISRSDDYREIPALNIEVRTAIGGRIVTFRSYDARHDRSDWKCYIINDEADFERELGKIITLESMRQ